MSDSRSTKTRETFLLICPSLVLTRDLNCVVRTTLVSFLSKPPGMNVVVPCDELNILRVLSQSISGEKSQKTAGGLQLRPSLFRVMTPIQYPTHAFSHKSFHTFHEIEPNHTGQFLLSRILCGRLKCSGRMSGLSIFRKKVQTEK